MLSIIFIVAAAICGFIVGAMVYRKNGASVEAKVDAIKTAVDTVKDEVSK